MADSGDEPAKHEVTREGVRWFVLRDGGHVSPTAVRRFHFVISRFPFYRGYPDNNRPVQPLNGRVISFQSCRP